MKEMSLREAFDNIIKKAQDNGKREERIRVMSILRKVLKNKITLEAALKEIYEEEVK